MASKYLSQSISALALISLQAAKAEALSFPTLIGVGYQNEETSQGLEYLSMAGGAPITVSGIMMAFMPDLNTVMVEPQWIEGAELYAPALTQNNEFNSNAIQGRIAYTTPSVMELLNADIDAFNGEYLPNGSTDQLEFELKIHNDDDLFSVHCMDKSYCMLKYKRNYTPQLVDVTPANVYKDQLIQFHVNAKYANHENATPADAWPFREIRLGETLVDWEDTVEQTDRLTQWTVDTLEAYVGDQQPGVDSEPRLLFQGGYALNMASARKCNFAGDECWIVKTHPKIESVTQNTGYTTGGQKLQINGYGLNGTDVQVLVDGVPCEVLENSSDSIECVTGEAGSESAIGYQPGQPGLQVDKIPGFSYNNLDNADYPVSERTLYTSFETYQNQDVAYMQVLSGWFTAPVTGEYRFFMSCDDVCRLWFDASNPFVAESPRTEAPELELIAERNWWSSWRNYFYDNAVNDQHKSEWIQLEAGASYYIKGETGNHSGNENFVVSLEIKPESDSASDSGSISSSIEDLISEETEAVPHPMASPTIQQIAIEQNNTSEEWSLTIGSPSGNLIKVNFLNPTTEKPSYWQSEEFSADASAGTFRNQIRSYYTTYFGGDIAVVRTMHDADAVETTDSTNATSYTYTVTLLKQITGFSANAVSISKVEESSSTFTVTPPNRGIKSTPPINGTYQLQCTDQYGQSYTTTDINYNTGNTWVQNTISNYIPFLADKIEVVSDYRYTYPENGLSYMIKFTGVAYDVAPCSILPGTGDYPISGNSDLATNVTVLQNFGETLWFEPIPLEFLTSDAQQPQVLVMINGLEALCANLNCDYSYTRADSVISGQSVSDSGLLVISGSKIPYEDDMKVMFGPTSCTIIAVSESYIECQLDDNQVTGDWIAEVTTSQGRLPNEIDEEISVAALVESIDPNIDINFLGGQTLTISGQNFGYDRNAVSVTLGETNCTILSVNMNEIRCLMQRLPSDISAEVGVTVTINGIVADDLRLGLIDAVEQASSLVPDSASPVLKTELTVFLSSDYSEILNREDFTLTLLNDADDTFEKELYVMSVDEDAKSIKVKFPGARSGDYHIQLESVQHGRIQSDVLALKVHGSITSVSPLEGSIYGGTLVTITGENFSDEPLDNPVKIGNDYCYVITSSPTEITCRTDLLHGKVESNELLLVFLKTSEEAYSPQDIEFAYVTPQAEVINIESKFDSDFMAHRVLVSGSGLNSTSIQLLIDGVDQLLVSVDATQALFEVVGLNGVVSDDVKIYTSEGYPMGSEISHYLEFAPSVLQISPSEGSAGGSWIQVTGSGFGLETSGLNLQVSDSGLLCEQVEITSYGVFNCLTIAKEIAEGSTVTVVIDSIEQVLSYVASDVAYSQVASIVVNEVELSTNSIYFLGEGFPTSDFTAHASLAGVEATQVTVNSDNEVLASWDLTGIPAVSASPALWFSHNDEVYMLYAVVTGVTVDKSVEVISTTAALSCSFAGGCTYAIEAAGLYATLMDDANSVEMCGSECVLREDLSDATYAVCQVPPLATTYSVQEYSIAGSQVLNATVFPAGSLLYDDDLTIDHTANSAGCSFGMNFKKDHVAVLDEAKVFIGFMTDKTHYVDKLVFQGSNDEWDTFTDLYTFGEQVHEGWNYINYSEVDDSEKPAYNSYRFYGVESNACRVTEFRLIGVEAIQNDETTYSCTPVIKLDGQELSVSMEPVFYSADHTGKLTGISPRFGSVLGGTTVTLTGENLGGVSAPTLVYFDGRDCAIESQSDTQIVCVTEDKPYVPDEPTVEINIEGLGHVATQGLVYRYVSLWSDTETWGGDIPPLEGESISIPQGQHLLVDIDETPILNIIIVEGSLIFPPNDTSSEHVRTLDASYIMIYGGYMEVGTEDFPYTSKLVITMHSDKYSPYLPIYGNKVIGVRFGTLDMHGITRDVVWTRLAETASVGDTSITLMEETDWAIGEEIVIAGTSFHNDDHETRFISEVSGTTFYFEEPLEHQHLSVAPVYGDVEFPMRAEVGLLTRNVVFRGDEETSAQNQYGAHIMIHSPGDESSIGRIEYIELKDVGQAFKLGRYPIHFHMIGTVHQSYVQGNAIHQTYNRAVTTHGVHYFRVINNVAYDTMGHTFFIEDAVETKNLYDHNLAIKVKKSLSLLNTDQTPGGFWITHPDNIVINNAIAGTDAYGFWYDMQDHAMGPSFDVNVCPVFAKLGEFRDNSAHSTHKYGLRIHHALIPRTNPCSSSPYDADFESKGETDPYWKNPKVPAIFERMTAWKCGRNGAITERTGAVVFKDFKVADNLIAGIEFSVIEDVVDGYAKVDGGLIVGNSGLNDDDGSIAMMTLWGLIGARTENFSVDGVSFYNFEQTDSAALGTCSHCFHGAATDSGARTYTVQNLKFDDATVPRRILYQVPFREIIHDLDGSLTGLGPDSWATFYYPHLDQPECTHSDTIYNGVICDSSVQVRRVAFYDSSPASFRMIPLKIAKWELDFEEEIKANEDTLWDFEQDVDHENFSILEFRGKLDPMNSWAVPMVTGHRYRLHWGENLDFTQMRLQMSERWETTDLNTYIMTNFTDVRASVNITDSKGTLIANETYTKKRWDYLVNGDNVVYNETDVREFHFVLNGKEQENRTELVITGHRCIVDCDQADIEECEIPDTVVLWSSNSSWPDELVPEAGADAEVAPCVNMLFDLDETPLLNLLTVNGRLSFKNDLDVPQSQTIHTKILYVRSGELLIGSEDEPYNGNATIILYGEPEDEAIAYHIGVETGNKVLAVVGMVKMYGQSRDSMSRLRESCFTSDISAKVYAGLDWQAGDRVALLPTASQYKHTDYKTIESYDIKTGEVTFTEKLRYYHWGQSSSTASSYNGIDMRGEVVLLSRNVRIVGNDTDSWGGQIVVSDNIESTGVVREGQLVLDNVEVYNCSQRNTFKSAIRFEQVNSKTQIITNSAVHGSIGWPFSSQYSSNILVDSTVFIGGRQIGFGVIGSGNVTMNNLIVADIGRRTELVSQSLVDLEACFTLCAFFGSEDCQDIRLTNSIAAGCPFAGFIAPGHECGESDTQDNFRGNVAHSVDGSGGHITPVSNSHKTCYEGSHFTAYKNTQVGLGVFFESKETRMSHMTMIDNTKGIVVQAASGGSAESLTLLENSHIYGEAGSADCPPGSKGSNCYCAAKEGLMLFSTTHVGKPFHIGAASQLPHYKLKSYGSWIADVEINNNTFEGFLSNETLCGAHQSIFKRNPYASDYIPLQKFYGNTFKDVNDDAMAFLEDPAESWNNPTDCIGFPCTAPSNIVMTFEKTKFEGKTPNQRQSDFQIISDTPGASETMDNCEFKESWNAWLCNNKNLGVLNFIGDDGDQEDRSVGPVFITNEESGYTNKLNSQMDHVWDGFYTGQKHKSQFPAMVQTDRDYTIEYTGTPFNNMRYSLIADRGAMKIKIHYWNAGSYAVYVNAKLMPSTPWDKESGNPAELTGTRGCGENRFVGVQNFLEFFLTENCIVTVVPVDAIKCNVRLQWTMAEFYSAGGTTSFTDRVAGALGIHASQIKIVAVYKGSVVVDYFIEAEDDDENSAQTLRALQSSLNTLITSGSTVFGAPVLSANTEDVAILEDPTYNPTVNTEFNTELATSQIVQPATQAPTQKITITETESISIIGATSGLIWILVVLVTVFVCCLGCGAGFLCCVTQSKKGDLAKKAAAQEIEIGENNMGGSEIDIHVQYQPNEDMDMDIFANKKRPMKFNDDNLNTHLEGTNQDMAVANMTHMGMNQSEKKLVQLSHRSQNNELQFRADE